MFLFIEITYEQIREYPMLNCQQIKPCKNTAQDAPIFLSEKCSLSAGLFFFNKILAEASIKYRQKYFEEQQWGM